MGNRIGRLGRQAGLAAITLAAAGLPAGAQEAGAQPPAFTAVQAEAGAEIYATQCAGCHGADLSGGPFGPAVAGAAFEGRWGGVPLDELARYIHNSMPPAAPGSLSDADYAAVLAFQMRRNGAEAGGAALPEDPAQLAQMAVPGEAGGGDGPPSFASMTTRGPIPEWPEPPNPLDGFTPVTEAELTDPDPEDWPTWRRSHRALGWSPLDQVDAQNVGDLGLAWSLALPAGPMLNEPLVRDGVMYVFAYGDEVFALNAATGDQLWRYQRHLPENGVQLAGKKTMALYGDKLLVATSDMHMLALDARTGRMIWDRTITDRADFRITGGPLAAEGVVMQGVVGRGAGGAIIAGFDIETGERLWTFNTIAQGDDPNADTWNGMPHEERTGGSVWTSGTYDAETGLAFFGPAPTYDTGPLRFLKDGENNDALYTDTTVAIHPRTGELAWHFQHMKNDQWDMDWAFERVIAELDRGDGARRVIITSGKEGLFDVLDAETGGYLTTVDMGIQNFVTEIDPETGDKRVDPAMLPGGRDDVFVLCPYGGGGRNWMGTSYNPDTQILYVVAQDFCTDVTPMPEGQGFLSAGANMDITPREDSDGRYGLIQALDMETGETLWRSRQRAPQTTGVLTTAGGLMFAGAIDRKFTAYDQATGDVLWSAGLTDTPNGAPVTYSVDGRQYVAMAVGYGSSVTAAFSGTVPEIDMPPVRSAAMFVFALPE